MDPKSRLANVPLKSEYVVSLIEEWVSRGHSYYWSMTVEDLVAKIKEHSPTISYRDAIMILNSAYSSKMIGHTGAGLGYIKDRLKGAATLELGNMKRKND